MAKVEKPLTPESFQEILDYTSAVDLVQALESRGDFKFKGIFSIFTAIHDWTNRFPSNGILPAMEQLCRDSNLPFERAQEYVKEMMGLGSSKTRCIFGMPAVDFISSPEPNIVNLIVYCRPTKTDGSSARRYVQSYVDKNVQALQKWLEHRTPHQGLEYSEYILQYIEKGRLPDSQAGAEIARMFYSDLDVSPEMKKITYSLYSRPVIQKLIESGHLLLLPEKGSADSGSYRGVFYSNSTQLEERIRILVNFFSNSISPVPISSPENIDELREALKLFDSARMSSLPIGYRQVVQEISILLPKVQRIKQEETKRKETESLDKFVEELSRSGRIVDLSRVKNANEEIKLKIPSISGVLYTEFPLQGKVSPLALHRNSVPVALKQAKDMFDQRGDDTELRILQAMDVDKYLTEEQMKEFQGLEQRMLFMKLPWVVRVWRSIFGNAKIKPEEAAKIKKEMVSRYAEEKIRIQTTEAKKAQKKLATERMKGGSSDESSSGSSSYEPPPAEQNFQEDQEKALERIQNEERLKQIVIELDKSWDQGQMPSRTFLMEKFPDFTEDSLILFLKKYARKEILSFRINHDKPEYVWPVLITRRYLKQHGKKMYSKYVHLADEQRQAAMPNQEKFDVATSIEDFLGRVLPKLN